MNKLNVTIGICAYNEEKNIANLLKALLNQETRNLFIEEILIISDGSTDRTNEIAKEFSSKNNKIKLIQSKERKGKSFAINELFKLAESPFLVLESADTVIHENAIEKLCLPLLDEDIGITSAHPMPKNSRDSFLGFIVNLQWELHHRVSLIQPKFGELIAFRNIIEKLPETAVDEEQIAYNIRTRGYRSKYVPEVIVYNKGPETMSEFLGQRRRIYAGHLTLKKIYNYEVATLRGIRILKCLFSNLSVDYIKNIHWLLFAILLEITGRILGRWDVFFNKKHYIWKIAKSSKNLNEAHMSFAHKRNFLK